MNNQKQELVVGSTWYIKVVNTTSLIERKIIELTEYTIVVEDKITLFTTRYKLSDLDFVEENLPNRIENIKVITSPDIFHSTGDSEAGDRCFK